jgi:glycosyltransferase involved in cell wall biosynthesis
MACGCGVIVSDLPSAREWVQDGRSGLVVPPRDIQALAAAMLRFASDTDFRRGCGDEALRIARRHAGFQMNMERVLQIFECLTAVGQAWPTDVALNNLARLDRDGPS